ncbi:oxidoreductase, partial [candidate division KSB3 bacterium]
APRIINQDFSPGFFVKHFIKDMTIAVESAEAMGLDLPGLVLARKLYEQLAAQGGANSGTQALYTLYEAK